MNSIEEVSSCTKNLEAGQYVQESMNRLLNLKMTMGQCRRFRLKHLFERYSKFEKFSQTVKVLLHRIRILEMKPTDPRRKRFASESLPCRKLPKRSPIPNRKPVSIPTEWIVEHPPIPSVSEKVPELIDVSELQNLEQIEYERLRPTLVTLTARQLKSFMDRNPEIEEIADGLFRRHCQVDCPQDVPYKTMTETWRTIHDVHINWKMYNETLQQDRVDSYCID